MHWITIILIGIAANLDNLGIGLAYGIKQTKIPIFSNVTIAIISMVVAYVAVVSGEIITNYIPILHANLLGSSLLCIIGLWTILSSILSNEDTAKKTEQIDKDGNNIISVREAISLGFILSVNCLISGIAIGASGISAIWTVISIGFFSILTVGIGSHFGLLLNKTFIGKYSITISGGILIFIGLYEMLD
ncbi:manganese efflux pump MntP family protein [Psychrobacillus sp. NPDC058041]|uniref:manganese efflux pump MntP n=1 Tax=Psychrobacillus sp. NPDC058041 TaxID=3346310 RepID=UPI0036DA88F5